MLSDEMPPKDDFLTLISISALGCILQDVLHEGLGHGVTAWLSGAHRVTMSTVALESDIGTRWISANGTLVNLVFAAIFWLLLRKRGYRPATRYFLIIALAGNLFTSTGYFLFSGVFDFGDWAAVIHGLQPHWAWRLGLVGSVQRRTTSLCCWLGQSCLRLVKPVASRSAFAACVGRRISPTPCYPEWLAC